MPYSESALRLAKPRTVELPRLADRISYFYFTKVNIVQDDTGLKAIWDSEAGSNVMQIPAASVGFVVLGPGVSITTLAVATLARAGASILFAGEDGAVGYACGRPLTSKGTWAMAQAKAWSDHALREQVVRRLYAHILPGVDVPAGTPIRVWRGLEGQYIKSLYKKLAAKHHLGRWWRETDPSKATDPVNPLLNLAHSMLYGAGLSACSALGLNPALGFIHQGASGALLYDLSDIYKPILTIPLAFELSHLPEPAPVLRRRVRQFMHERHMLDELIGILDECLGTLVGDGGDVLYDGRSAVVEGMRNYGQDAGGQGVDDVRGA